MMVGASVPCCESAITASDVMRAREERRLRRARVPPLRETALRVGVDERHRPGAGTVRLDREMTREGGLAGPALLGCDGDNVHIRLSWGARLCGSRGYA